MTQSVLGSVTLGYRPLWNRARALAGIELFVHDDMPMVEGQHLLRTIDEQWVSESPPLVLKTASRGLLASLLLHVQKGQAAIRVPLDWLDSPALCQAVLQARQRGARLLASGTPGQAPPAEVANAFERTVVQLSVADAAVALQAARQLKQAAAEGRIGQRSQSSPVQPRMLVEGVASRALVEHALDQQGAWAVAGWPMDDMVHRYAGQPVPLSRRALVACMTALEREESLDRIESLIGREPALAYRLMLYFNSPGLGVSTGVSTIRHGLMMLGFRRTVSWMAEQLPQATDDANLNPLNESVTVRAHLMTHLLDAGVEDDLRREIYLCGLFSQLELVMDEPLKTSYARIPLPDRIVHANISHSGPYAWALDVAMAAESEDPARLRALRLEHELGAEEVNRALLRTLSAITIG